MKRIKIFKQLKTHIHTHTRKIPLRCNRRADEFHYDAEVASTLIDDLNADAKVIN